MLMRAGEPPAPVTLPLLCALGRHKTDGLARWNAGYYFARCTRCRRDLVRTAFTRWQIPRGFRVVWQGEVAQAHGSDLHRSTGPFTQVEFPIREDGALHAVPDTMAAPDTGTDEPVRERSDGTDEDRAPDPADADLEYASAEHADTDDVEAEHAGAADRPDVPGPSWFDREHSFEDEVRFDADDRLADYIPPDAEDAGDASAPDSDEIEDGAVTAVPEVEPEPEPEIEPEPAPAPPPSPPVSSKYPVVPDFMDEGPAGVGWVVVSGHIVPQPGPLDPTPDVPAQAERHVPQGLLSQSWQDLVRKRAQGASEQGREWLRGKRVRPARRKIEAPPEAVVPAAPAAAAPPAAAQNVVAPVEAAKPRITVSDEAPVGDVPPARASAFPAVSPLPAMSRRLSDTLLQHSPLAAALLFGALVFAAAVVDNRNSPARVVYRDAPAPQPERAAVPVTRPGAARLNPVRSDVAYVTAGLLNCRATPSDDAETLRRLSRGAQLRVLGSSPGWIGVAHQGRQCWVSAQHVSSTKPS